MSRVVQSARELIGNTPLLRLNRFEKELGIELVGDEKVKIAIDENEDPWDEIIDDVNDKQIDNEVDENFIKEDESI